MTKEELKRLKAGLLALSLCFTLSSCKKKEEKNETKNEAAVFFVQGKALIYEEGYPVYIGEEYSSIGDSIFINDGNKYTCVDTTIFSSGIEAIKVQSKEDAIELATAIVGSDNIIYISYKDEDMGLTYVKK